MKTSNRFIRFSLFCVIISVGAYSCKKKETPAQVPTLNTIAVTNILPTSAQCSAKITSDGGASITESGVCWSTNPEPQVGDQKAICTDTSHFTLAISPIENNVTYYARAYAVNEAGVGYGNVVSFLANKLADGEGNIYTSVQIGAQVWMLENLRVSKYNNGDLIEQRSDTSVWRKATNGLFTNYNDDAGLLATYGHLYNWYALTDVRGIAPRGWRIPSRQDWEVLIQYLGGKDIAGAALKELGLAHWDSPNKNATNSSGFTALPGGYFYFYESRSEALGVMGVWWSASEQNYQNAYSFTLSTESGAVAYDNPAKVSGFSVRCIKK